MTRSGVPTPLRRRAATVCAAVAGLALLLCTSASGVAAPRDAELPRPAIDVAGQPPIVLAETSRYERRSGPQITPMPRQQTPSQGGALAGFTCGPKRYCREMTSCAEARFYLYQCGLRRLDGDSDGVPCEMICGRQ